jgi:hypothetical protein
MAPAPRYRCRRGSSPFTYPVPSEQLSTTVDDNRRNASGRPRPRRRRSVSVLSTSPPVASFSATGSDWTPAGSLMYRENAARCRPNAVTAATQTPDPAAMPRVGPCPVGQRPKGEPPAPTRAYVNRKLRPAPEGELGADAKDARVGQRINTEEVIRLVGPLLPPVVTFHGFNERYRETQACCAFAARCDGRQGRPKTWTNLPMRPPSPGALP